VGWLNTWYEGLGLYVCVVRRRVVDVPREMMQSIGERGRDAMVAGLSPVNGIMIQSVLSAPLYSGIDLWGSCIWS